MTDPLQLTGRHVVVAGAGVSGRAAVDALLAVDARVTVVDARGAGDSALPVELVVDDQLLPPGTELVITSPGWRPDAPLLVAAAAAGIAVWGEVELAWRLKPAAQQWLVVTGTNGKTTTTGLLAAILDAAGLHAAAAGNIGAALVDAVRADPPFAVLAVELSSFQLHWSQSVRPFAAVITNVADDHLDWHGSRSAYAAAKAKAWTDTTIAVYDADDPGASALAEGHAAARAGGQATGQAAGPVAGQAAADVGRPPPPIGVTRGVPGDEQLGVAEGWLVDRAFGHGRLLPQEELPLPGPHNLSNALCAAALALSYGVTPEAVATGLRGFTGGAHRMALVARIAGVDFVDDSKGTNPHASAAAITSYPHVVWIAGGLTKGASFDEFVPAVRDRLRAVVLIGRDAALIEAALSRHAVDIPVITVGDLDNAVRAAAGFAHRGDTVLLSPAAASMDMFTDYHHRGEVFAAAVRTLAGDFPPEDA